MNKQRNTRQTQNNEEKRVFHNKKYFEDMTVVAKYLAYNCEKKKNRLLHNGQEHQTINNHHVKRT